MKKYIEEIKSQLEESYEASYAILENGVKEWIDKTKPKLTDIKDDTKKEIELALLNLEKELHTLTGSFNNNYQDKVNMILDHIDEIKAKSHSFIDQNRKLAEKWKEEFIVELELLELRLSILNEDLTHENTPQKMKWTKSREELRKFITRIKLDVFNTQKQFREVSERIKDTLSSLTTAHKAS